MQKPERPAHKIFSLAVKELRKYFLPPHEEMLFCSTYFRMFYLSQPITGLLTKTSQLFSGRVISEPALLRSETGVQECDATVAS
jgi:hypothetical protein